MPSRARPSLAQGCTCSILGGPEQRAAAGAFTTDARLSLSENIK